MGDQFPKSASSPRMGITFGTALLKSESKSETDKMNVHYTKVTSESFVPYSIQ